MRIVSRFNVRLTDHINDHFVVYGDVQPFLAVHDIGKLFSSVSGKKTWILLSLKSSLELRSIQLIATADTTIALTT